MTAWIPRSALACLAASLAVLLAGCGGGEGGAGVFAGIDREVRTFWAADFTTNTDYRLQAYKAGEGAHCYVYVEAGRTVAQPTIDRFIDEFEANIYPAVTGAFGGEPSPGIDGDPKIYLLLLDIRDGYAGPGDSYVGGYFYPVNEATQSQAAQDNLVSNEKEMLYVDIDPGVAGDPGFLRVVAHELQHMIHFEQKWGAYQADDDDWLNEAMSEAAPLYCNYGADYERVYTFESEWWNSLTTWANRTPDYAVAYMWAHYMKDRVDPASGNTVFWRTLHRPETGIASVNAALAEIGYAKDFTGVFRDWSVANYSGNALSWTGHPEWSYATLDTWPGVYSIGGGYAVTLPGLFGYAGFTNSTTLFGQEPWSVDYYLYTPLSGNSGSVTWTASPYSSQWASLGDNAILTYGLTSGTAYPYTGAGHLVVANPSTSGYGGFIYVGHLARDSRPATVRAMLAENARSAAVQRLVAMTGRPVSLCVHPLLREKARPLAARGIRPPR